MFESMKRAMLAGVVVAVAALAVPAMASAAEWDVDGTPVGGSPGVSVASGDNGANFSLTTYFFPGASATMSCDVAVEADVWNVSGVGAGSVTDFDLQASTCAVYGVAGNYCRVTSVVPSMPWTLTTSGSTVTFGSVSFTYTMVDDGGSCFLAGSRVVTGSVTGDWYDAGSWEPDFPGVLAYNSAPGLTINPGPRPTMASGSFDLAPVNGGGLYLR